MSKANKVCDNYDLTLYRCKLGIEKFVGICVEGYGCPNYRAEMPSEIEEMANDLAQHCPDLVENCCGESSCVSCLTRFLYEAGYRKQSEKMVEVVRCCDCKYCEVVINDIICEPKYFCTRLIGCFPADPTDYCSRAVKKGGE